MDGKDSKLGADSVTIICVLPGSGQQFPALMGQSLAQNFLHTPLSQLVALVVEALNINFETLVK